MSRSQSTAHQHSTVFPESPREEHKFFAALFHPIRIFLRQKWCLCLINSLLKTHPTALQAPERTEQRVLQQGSTPGQWISQSPSSSTVILKPIQLSTPCPEACPRPAFHKNMGRMLPSTQYIITAQEFNLQAPVSLWLPQELITKDSA